MDASTVQSKDSLSCLLLEFAADNNLQGFRSLIEDGSSLIDEIGCWYGRRRGSKRIVLDQRTPLMVAATYGSVDVVRYLLAQDGVNVNLSCGMENTTALHCAASGGSSDAMDVVKILLAAGAHSNGLDGNGYRPIGVIVVHPKLSSRRGAFECLLSDTTNDVPFDIAVGVDKITGSLGCCNLLIAISTSTSSSPTLSLSLENGSSPSPSLLVSSPMSSKFSEKKEYPIDPSLPDIKNTIYSSDEFHMYSFKVRPCSRHTLMTGRSVHLCTLGRMPEEGTHGNSTTAVCLVRNSIRELAGEEICVNMHMESLSAGYIQLNIAHVCAKMVQIATDVSFFFCAHS